MTVEEILYGGELIPANPNKVIPDSIIYFIHKGRCYTECDKKSPCKVCQYRGE